MKRYHVDTPSKLEAVRIALDKANGLRAADGTRTPRQCRIFRDGVDVTGTHYDPATHGHPVLVTDTVGPPIVADDGTASLELPMVPEVDAHLGKTFGATKLPTDASCIRCARPSEHDKLPDGVMVELDAQAIVGHTDEAAVEELGEERAARARAKADENAGKPSPKELESPTPSPTRVPDEGASEG